jgi:hypothetical protein
MTGPVGTTGGATGKALGVAPQLTGGNRSRTKDCGDYGCEQCRFDCFYIHDQVLSSQKLKARTLALSVHGGLVAGKALFQICHGGVSHHTRPDLLHFSVAID